MTDMTLKNHLDHIETADGMIKKSVHLADELFAFIELHRLSLVHFWMTTTLWSLIVITQDDIKKTYKLLKTVLDKIGARPVDQDDQLSEQLLNMQITMNREYSHIAELNKRLQNNNSLIAKLVRWELNNMLNSIVYQHKMLGQMRMDLMEHDAECSPVIGSFDNADDLIRALKN